MCVTRDHAKGPTAAPLLLVAGVLLAAAPGNAACIDLNAAPPDDLRQIVHIDEARAAEIIDGRPWPEVAALTQVHGIGPARLADIEEQGLACVGYRVPADEREVIRGRAVVWDGDTLHVAGERVRAIGIDAPEGNQMCRLDGLDWPCGAVATATMFALVGTAEVSCEVYGRDRFERALAVCYRDGLDLNREIARLGYALAWYPERGVVLVHRCRRMVAGLRPGTPVIASPSAIGRAQQACASVP